MKKVLTILLITCYLLCAFGVNITFHHCGGKLKYVNLNSEKQKCCNGKKMAKDCCKTVKVHFSKSDDKNQSTFIFNAIAPIKYVNENPTLVLLNKYQIVQLLQTNYCLPPPFLRQSDLPIYLANSVFLI